MHVVGEIRRAFATQIARVEFVTMFVNRVPELGILEESFNGLLKREDHFRPSILDFYGVKGIGKTTLLKKFSEKLMENNIRHIEIKFDNDESIFYKRMYEQLQKYGAVQPLETEPPDISERSMQQVKELLEQGPLVLLLDAIDTPNESRMEFLEEMFSKLVIYQTLFVVLASQRRITFENERSVRHKLKTFLVEPFDEQSTCAYAQQLDASLTSEQCTLIFDWTHGYPLAINEMVGALHDGLDPQDEQGSQPLAQRIVDRVIVGDLLAKVKPDEREWYLSMLYLLAVPRRFSLSTLQQLIEHFKPDYKLPSSLAYLVLPKRIDQATGVVGWDMAKAGFTLSQPTRHILLLNLKINQHDFYLRLHQYLAELNRQNMAGARGHERILYQREYLYHCACGLDTLQLEEVLAEVSAEILLNAEGQPDALIQFLEEFQQDKELQEVLSSRVAVLTNRLYQRLGQKMDELYQQETQSSKRLDYLRSLFYYTAINTDLVDKVSILTLYVRDLLSKEGRERVIQLYDELAQNSEFRDAMGADFAILLAAMSRMVASEG